MHLKFVHSYPLIDIYDSQLERVDDVSPAKIESLIFYGKWPIWADKIKRDLYRPLNKSRSFQFS